MNQESKQRYLAQLRAIVQVTTYRRTGSAYFLRIWQRLKGEGRHAQATAASGLIRVRAVGAIAASDHAHGPVAHQEGRQLLPGRSSGGCAGSRRDASVHPSRLDLLWGALLRQARRGHLLQRPGRPCHAPTRTNRHGKPSACTGR